MAVRIINSRFYAVITGFFIIGLAMPAHAHLVTTGMGPVYDGIAHLLLTPEDLIFVLIVGVYSGLCGRKRSKVSMFLLPLTWVSGALIGTFINPLPDYPYAALGFILFGVLAAADFKLSLLTFGILVSLFGLTHGIYNGVAMQGGPGIPGLLGIIATIFILSPLTSAVVVALQYKWCRIAFRVTGSWVAACGLLLLGWHFQ